MSSSPPILVHRPEELPYAREDPPRSSDPNGDVLQVSRDNNRFTSVTVPVPKEIQYMVSSIVSILDKLDPMERRYIGPIVTVLGVETAFLKFIGRSNKDVLSIILLTVLFELAGLVWLNLKRMQCQFDDVYGRIDVLQKSIKSLESTPASHPPVERPDDLAFLTRDDPTLKSTVHSVLKPVDPESEELDGPSVAIDHAPYSPYELPAVAEPANPSVAVMKSASPVPPAFPGSYRHAGVMLEGMDDVVEVSDSGTDPVKAPLVIENLPSPPPTALSRPDRGMGVTLEGMDNIIGLSDVGLASGSTEQPRPTQELASSHWLPTLCEIKQRIEELTEGKLERTSHLDQSEPSHRVQLRRCAVRLLMTSASFSPADFASPVGFLSPSESPLYYPTGDTQKDRIVAFIIAMECLDHLEGHLHGNDYIRIATTLFELAQALSDLGLHKYALDTSGFALDALEGQYVATPEDSRHHVASILSLRGSILYDLKQNNEAIHEAHRAVTLFREHQESQTTPVPELAFASLDCAVLLNTIGLKDDCAAVVLELLGEVDESQPDMKDVSALCNLCLSNMRFDAEDGMDMSTAEEAVKLTHTSSDTVSQTVLAGALLNKSKILSSRGQNEAALPFSTKAISLFRGMRATRPVFSLFLAHALDNHARIHLEAGHQSESYAIRHDATNLWQTLKDSTPDPIARPWAWSLFELSKFRHEGRGRNELREDLRRVERAVDAFREVVPPDIPGLADALYLFADRMFELDENREAATYAEESAQYFREASAEDPKYALDLILSLTLASSCLAYTERAEDAFERAKQAVEVQHGRKGVEDKQYDAHLRLLLMNVVTRSMEMDKLHEAVPWLQELQALDPSIEKSWNPLLRRSGTSHDNRGEFTKQTSYWMDPNTDAQRPNNSFTSSTPVASSSTVKVEMAKGKELDPSPDTRGFITRDVKGKAKEVKPVYDPVTPGHSLPDEEIFSPGAAAQRRVTDLRSMMGPLQEDIFGGNSSSNNHLNGMPGIRNDTGGHTLGGLGTSDLGMGGLGIAGGMDGLGSNHQLDSVRSLGDSINGFTENILGNLGRFSPDFSKQGDAHGASSHINDNKVNGGNSTQGGANSQPRTGTWSGMGIKSKLSDEGA